jgi:hypothetical protein
MRLVRGFMSGRELNSMLAPFKVDILSLLPEPCGSIAKRGTTMASNDTRQSFIEDFHLGVFAELHPLPGTPLPRVSGQKPDFLFESSGKLVGIEHTELTKDKRYSGNPSRAELKGTQRGIVARAAALAEEAGLPPISVNIWFHDYNTSYPNKGESLAIALFEHVRGKMDYIQFQGAHRSVKIVRGGDIQGILMATAISGTAFGSDGLKHHRWTLQEPGFVRFDFAQDLQAAINKKNSSYQSYIEKCSECWLLIVTDRTRDDQRFEMDEPTRSALYQSRFTKTLFMETTERLLVELSTIDPSAGTPGQSGRR